ncbi:MAG: UDP-glucose 4-epimerase [Verrucomicrobiales bacterium]|jgi:UDP-glucose 4-epimerase
MKPFPKIQLAPQRMLVTGAAGFIGSHTVDLLISEGYDVLGIDDLSTGRIDNLSQAMGSGRFELRARDLLEPDFLDDTVADWKPDVIIHLAGLVSVVVGQDKPARNFRLNIESTKTVCEAARKQEIGRIVFASSAAVYGDPDELPLRENDPKDPASNYGSAKLISEMLLMSYAKSYGLTAISNRYFNVFGPRQDPASPYSGVISIFADRFANNETVTIFGDGRQSRDFISVFDIARGNVLAATRPNSPSGAYNLCSGSRQTLLDLVEQLRTQYPMAPRPLFAEERPGEIRHSLGSAEKARSYLGFEATVNFADGIAELIAPATAKTEAKSAA